MNTKVGLRFLNIILAIMLIGGIFLLSQCGGEKTIEKVTFTTSKNAWCTLPIVAFKQGYFRDEGLDVDLQYVQAAKFSMDALVAGTSDFSDVVETNMSFLGYTGNTNVEIVATVSESYDGAIVARKDAGIQAPKDLEGKKLGILQGTTSHIFADRFIEKHGLDRSKVSIINLTPVAIQSSIMTKDIDAGSIWQPFIYNIQQQLKDDAVVFADRKVYTGYMNLAVRKDWASKHSKTINKFLKAVIKAENFVKKNKQEAIEIMAKEINLDVPVLSAIWEQYYYEVYLSPVITNEIKREGDWIRESQDKFKDKELPAYEGVVNPSFLKAIDSSRVREGL